MDETGIQSCLDRTHGYAPRGEKVFGETAGKRFHRTNFVAAKCGGEIIAPMQYQGTMNGALFEAWFEQQLLPAAAEDAVIVMDNASFHRKKRLFDIAEEHGVKLIFLPPYSPELNPIEKIWANIKRWLRKNTRNFSSFDEAISAAFESLF